MAIDLNLPEAVQRLAENMILLAVIPGPKMPENFTPYVNYLVGVWLKLWRGYDRVLDASKPVDSPDRYFKVAFVPLTAHNPVYCAHNPWNCALLKQYQLTLRPALRLNFALPAG